MQADPAQFGDLRLPPGKGPFPVVVVIHGGCWYSTVQQFLDSPIGVLSESGSNCSSPAPAVNHDHHRTGPCLGGKRKSPNWADLLHKKYDDQPASRQVRQILESKISIFGRTLLNEEQERGDQSHPPSAEAAAFAGDVQSARPNLARDFVRVRFGPRIETL